MVKLFLALAAMLASHSAAFTLEGLPGSPFTPSASPLGHLHLALSAGISGHQDASMIRDGIFEIPNQGNPAIFDTALIQDLQSASLRLNAALGIGRHFDLGLSLPYHIDYVDDTQAKALSGAGLGDPEISAKGSLTLAGDHVFDAALLATLTLPSKTGRGFLPKQSGYMPKGAMAAPRYFSSYGPGGSMRLLLTLDLTRLEELPLPFRGSLGIGPSFSGSVGAEGRLLLGGGLEWLVMPYLGLSAGAQTETPMSQAGEPAKWGGEMTAASLGFTARGDDGIFFSLHIRKSLADRPFRAFHSPSSEGTFIYSARFQPSLSLAAGLGWTGALVAVDSDKDGIPDKQDICPAEKEDMDGFQDQDGCPDPDNDGDGVSDLADKCPTEPEDMDGFQDQDGCPDPDNDGDGVPDTLDKCPNEPEDKDGFQDQDGCPDIDNDRDGIPDSQDKCPDLAEDLDGFEDDDGCPDPDNDQDRIPDSIDKCPNEPETYNGFEDSDGCPDISRSMQEVDPLEKRLLLKKVRFVGNTAELQPESYPSLDSLAERIRAALGALVEVRGYWDNAGKPAMGLRISEARAEAVRKYLISRGVAADLILAKGMGAMNPIGNNKTAAGRLQNRRIELYRLD